MRVAGTNSFRYVNGAADGSISVLKGNFEPSTDYEWHTKAWCTGNVDANGDSDPQYHSGWGDFSTFSTQAPCDKMPTNFRLVLMVLKQPLRCLGVRQRVDNQTTTSLS